MQIFPDLPRVFCINCGVLRKLKMQQRKRGEYNVNKATMTAAGLLAGMVVGGTVGMVVGGKRETRRMVKKTEKAVRAMGDMMPAKMRMK